MNVLTDKQRLAHLLCALVTRNRELLWQMLKREAAGRYRGTWLGATWALLTPLLMLAIYTFVFAVVFQARFGAEQAHPAQFAVMLYAGMLVHGIMAETLTRAPLAIVGQVNFVKKVVFPLEVLPVVVVLSALWHMLLGTLVLVAAVWIVQDTLQWTILYLPLVLLPYALLCLGIAWALAALGVYLRDIAQLTGMLSTALLFLSPIFYPLELLPESLRAWAWLNPLTLIIEQLRAIMVQGLAPNWEALALYAILGMITTLVGLWCFMQTRRGFADVL